MKGKGQRGMNYGCGWRESSMLKFFTGDSFDFGSINRTATNDKTVVPSCLQRRREPVRPRT